MIVSYNTSGTRPGPRRRRGGLGQHTNRVTRVHREWLLNEHVTANLQHLRCQLGMCGCRRGEEDRVERGQRQRLRQSVEVRDIGVVPDAPRNRLGPAAAHQRDDIEGRSDASQQPAPPGHESGEDASRSAGTPRVIEHESARIRWPHGSTWPVGRQGSSESARACRFFAPRSGQHRLALGAAG